MAQSDQEKAIEKESLANQEQAEQSAVQTEKVPAEVKIEQETAIQPEKELEEVKLPEEIAEEVPPAQVTPVEPTTPPAVKSETLERIEDILEEDIEDIYFQMTPEKQQEFKKVGEETATKIENLLGQVKIKVREIIKLIKNWLSIFPGLNRFFLEQEVKLKTDKILDLKKDNQQSESPQDQNRI